MTETLRDKFAMAFMAAHASSGGAEYGQIMADKDGYARVCYQYADAMLKARQSQPETEER